MNRLWVRRRLIAGLALALAAGVLGPAWHRRHDPPGGMRRVAYTVEPAPEKALRTRKVLATGYCNCGVCCGWHRDWFGFGRPVLDHGLFARRHRPKRVGITARGTVARHGTIAADPAVFGFGTRLYVPGYGYGKVEDVGGAIKGAHVDLWFSTHAEAQAWGRRTLEVSVVE